MSARLFVSTFSFLFVLSLQGFGAAPVYRDAPEFKTRSARPAFTSNRPALCFDEGHNNLSVKKGRYLPVLSLLESDGFKVTHMIAEFDEKNLSSCKVLFISAAMGDPNSGNFELASQSAFKEKEITAIEKWVKKGGGLAIMTDHKPMSNAAAALMKVFGIEGSLVNVTNPKRQLKPFDDPGIFEVSGTDLDPQSPVIRGRTGADLVKKVYFFYGQALKGPKDADVFLKAGPDAVITETKSMQGFSGLGLAMKVEKGRVVALGDATTLTSKFDIANNERVGINRSGSDNVQLALNIFRWLAEEK